MRSIFGILVCIILISLLAGCEAGITGYVVRDTPNVQEANPASVYCHEQGYELKIRTEADGSQIGYCVSDDGECEEWAFYNKECDLK